MHLFSAGSKNRQGYSPTRFFEPGLNGDFIMFTGVPLAWRNLMHDKRRFAVSLTGIAFAVLLMFVELGFWNAMLDAAVELLKQCKGDLVIVSKSTYTLAIRETFSTQRLVQANAVPE